MRSHGDTNLRDLDTVRTWGESRPDIPESVARPRGGRDLGPVETGREGMRPEMPEEEGARPIADGSKRVDTSAFPGHGGVANAEGDTEEEWTSAMPIGSENRTPAHPRTPQGTPTPDGVRPPRPDVAGQPAPRPTPPTGESVARDPGRAGEVMSPPVGPDGPAPGGPGPLRPEVAQASSQAAMPPVGEDDPENPEIRQSTAEGFRPRPEDPPRPEV
jgi:hypothetical protein